MADKIFAPLAILGLLLSVGYLAVAVNEWNLWLVIVGVVILAIVDFIKTLREGDTTYEPEGKEGRSEPGGGAGPI